MRVLTQVTQGLPARSSVKTTQGLPARSSVKTGHWPVFRALLTHRIIFRACLTPSQPFQGLPARFPGPPHPFVFLHSLRPIQIALRVPAASGG